ncbi:hypothetical protein KC325_g169 [Hortaea werneckii]|nr:hypothetical protein KC325_g169 [Hortaea werneckii]
MCSSSGSNETSVSANCRKLVTWAHALYDHRIWQQSITRHSRQAGSGACRLHVESSIGPEGSLQDAGSREGAETHGGLRARSPKGRAA